MILRKREGTGKRKRKH